MIFRKKETDFHQIKLKAVASNRTEKFIFCQICAHGHKSMHLESLHVLKMIMLHMSSFLFQFLHFSHGEATTSSAQFFVDMELCLVCALHQEFFQQVCGGIPALYLVLVDGLDFITLEGLLILKSIFLLAPDEHYPFKDLTVYLQIPSNMDFASGVL